MIDELWNSKSISSRYDFVERLGKGGFGSVYKAKDKSLDKFVAIKVVTSELSPEQARRFQQEAKLAGKLNHPNIVSILDFGVTEANQPYLVMEYLGESSLTDLIREAPLELHEGLDIFVQICLGMSHSHAAGILHRDLKPSNIIVFDNESGKRQIKIVDFGLAKLKDEDGHLTSSGVMMGTPYFSSPEQIEGRRDVDERSDIYSMGCLMYKCLTGSPPFSGETALDTLMLKKTQAPKSLSEMTGETFPDGIEHVVETSLMVDPTDRYQSFDSLKRELVGVFEAYTTPSDTAVIHPYSDSPSAYTPPIQKWRPGWKTILASSVLLIGAIILIVPSLVEGPSRVEHKQVSLYDDPELDKVNNFKITFDQNGFPEISCPIEVEPEKFKELRKYKKISLLNFSDSSFTGTELESLSDSEITAINLNDCPISDEGLKQIALVHGLNRLEIHCEKTSDMTDAGVGQLSSCPTLETLEFSGKRITEHVFDALKPSKSLRMIQPAYMTITDKGIESILAIEGLIELQFRNCKLTRGAFSRLKKRNKLHSMAFVHTRLSEQDVDQILQLPIAELKFYYPELSPKALMKLKGDKRFSRIYVTAPGITVEEVESFKRSFPKTVTIDVSDGTKPAPTKPEYFED